MIIENDASNCYKALYFIKKQQYLVSNFHFLIFIFFVLQRPVDVQLNRLKVSINSLVEQYDALLRSAKVDGRQKIMNFFFNFYFFVLITFLVLNDRWTERKFI